MNPVAEMVMEIFCKQALQAQDEINPLTQHWMERAIRQARALDAEFERTGTPKGLLHGVPISVKEQIDVEGTGLSGHMSAFPSAVAFLYRRIYAKNKTYRRDSGVFTILRRSSPKKCTSHSNFRVGWSHSVL